jgi:GAF domain-containing protein/HAMP domain-containing protein
MILSRKILVPIIALFTALFLALYLFAYFVLQDTYKREANLKLDSLKESFYSEIENQEKLALSLAAENANNVEVQKAFAARDREKLLEITTPSLERLSNYWVSQYQFITNDGFAFLRVQSPENFGDDITDNNPMIVDVIKSQQPVGGMDVGKGGVSMRGISPVIYISGLFGYVEFAVGVDNNLLAHLQEEHGAEWHILLTQEVVVSKTPEDIASMQGGPVENLLMVATTNTSPIFAPQSVYQQALAGEDVVEFIQANNRDYAVLITPLQDYSGNIIGLLEIVDDRTNIVDTQNRLLLSGGGIGMLLLVAGIAGLIFLTQRNLRPIQVLTSRALELSEGKPTEEFVYSSNDEIGDLAFAFNKMAEQNQNAIATLEQSVQDRTQNLQKRSLELETVADVAREIGTIRELNTLLNVASNLIRERFRFYQVSIFLVDERAEFAILRAASGPAADALLEQNYKLKVGTVGIVGSVARTGQAHIALDTSADTVHFKNPLLPETRSEIALPLRIKSLIIGVLDIQATIEDAFEESDTQTFQILADQLAAAIENANLAQQVDDLQTELKKTYQAEAQRTWELTTTQQKNFAFEYDGLQIQPVPQNLPPPLMDQLKSGRPVPLKQSGDGQEQNILIIPLMVSNQLIGVIGLEQEDPNRAWTNEEIAIAQAAANRAAITLENARLLEESQRRAAKEQTISEATARIGTALNIENILDVTAEELERVLGSTEVILQINTESRSGNKSK